jgi:hypothetical protein
VPTADNVRLRALRRFTARFVRKNFIKVDRQVLHFYDWLLSTSYTESERAALVYIFEYLRPGECWRVFHLLGPILCGGLSFEAITLAINTDPSFATRFELLLRRDGFRRRDLLVKSFVKAEHYPTFKMCRVINGRIDFSKIIFGPLIKTVEKIIYKHPSFIKTIPLAERPLYYQRLVGGPGVFWATDHTSFESSFTMGLCISVEFEVYSWILNCYYAELICKAFYTLNVCVFKFFKLKVSAKRMSGDMNTSLGNGITNLITILFLYHEKYGLILISIVIEGDDSLFRTDRHLALSAKDFATLGLVTKIEMYERLCIASFCGNIFDEDDLKNLVDPGKIFRRFGYADNKYFGCRKSKKMGLLRAYAFSIYYQYHGCPMVESLARYLIRVTRGYFAIMNSINIFKLSDNDVIPASEQRMFELFPPGEIGIGSRCIIQSQFGFSYDQQISVEKYLDSLNQLEILRIPIIVNNSHPDTVSFFHSCSTYVGENIKMKQKDVPFNFRDLLRELKARLAHLNRRHAIVMAECLMHSTVNYDLMGDFCSCGHYCPYYYDLFDGLRPKLGLKPTPYTVEIAPNPDERGRAYMQLVDKCSRNVVTESLIPFLMS